MCERYAVPFAMQFDSSSFPVSLQPLTMALAFHFSIGQYKYIKFLKMFLNDFIRDTVRDLGGTFCKPIYSREDQRLL